MVRKQLALPTFLLITWVQIAGAQVQQIARIGDLKLENGNVISDCWRGTGRTAGHFVRGDTEAGVGAFIDYVFNDPGAWVRMSQPDRAAALRDAHEWDVMMTSGELFPEIDPAAIRGIRVPVLVMSGGASYPFLQYIDQELVRLMPNSKSIVYPDAGHQMGHKYPVLCRDDVEAFFLRNP